MFSRQCRLDDIVGIALLWWSGQDDLKQSLGSEVVSVVMCHQGYGVVVDVLLTLKFN